LLAVGEPRLLLANAPGDPRRLALAPGDPLALFGVFLPRTYATAFLAGLTAADFFSYDLSFLSSPSFINPIKY
jgi:hypothetical protein